jgi:hypothetical protein
MSIIETTLWNSEEAGKEKRMIRMPTISKYIAFVQVDDITTCTENC